MNKNYEILPEEVTSKIPERHLAPGAVWVLIIESWHSDHAATIGVYSTAQKAFEAYQDEMFEFEEGGDEDSPYWYHNGADLVGNTEDGSVVRIEPFIIDN